MTGPPPDRLAAEGLDMLRGAAAAEPGLIEDDTRYAAAVDDILDRLDATGDVRDRLRRTLLATRSQLADAGS